MGQSFQLIDIALLALIMGFLIVRIGGVITRAGMKAFSLRLLATIIALPLQAVAVLLLIGIYQTEVGAPKGSEFPYLLVVVFPFVPLLTAIWVEQGRPVQRAWAWLAGIVSSMVALVTVHPIVIKEWAFEALHGDPFGLRSILLFVAFYAICVIAGFVPVWMILRRPSRNSLG